MHDGTGGSFIMHFNYCSRLLTEKKKQERGSTATAQLEFTSSLSNLRSLLCPSSPLLEVESFESSGSNYLLCCWQCLLLKLDSVFFLVFRRALLIILTLFI